MGVYDNQGPPHVDPKVGCPHDEDSKKVVNTQIGLQQSQASTTRWATDQLCKFMAAPVQLATRVENTSNSTPNSIEHQKSTTQRRGPKKGFTEWMASPRRQHFPSVQDGSWGAQGLLQGFIGFLGFRVCRAFLLGAVSESEQLSATAL